MPRYLTSAWLGRSDIQLPNRRANCFEDAFQILMNVAVLKSQQPYSLGLEKFRPLCVGLLTHDVVVDCAIKLDSQVALWTEEIHHVSAHAILTPEFLSEKLATLQVLPEEFFRASWIVSGANVREVGVDFRMGQNPF